MPGAPLRQVLKVDLMAGVPQDHWPQVLDWSASNMQLLFGPLAADWQLTLVHDYKGFLLAILPPGAFLVLGLLIALKNRIDHQLAERAKAAEPATPAVSRRVRVTGTIE